MNKKVQKAIVIFIFLIMIASLVGSVIFYFQ